MLLAKSILLSMKGAPGVIDDGHAEVVLMNFDDPGQEPLWRHFIIFEGFVGDTQNPGLATGHSMPGLVHSKPG